MLYDNPSNNFQFDEAIAVIKADAQHFYDLKSKPNIVKVFRWTVIKAPKGQL